MCDSVPSLSLSSESLSPLCSHALKRLKDSTGSELFEKEGTLVARFPNEVRRTAAVVFAGASD